MTRLFLDCEWADEIGRELVSLALVSQDGEIFYAERNPLPSAPSSFVCAVVYPLLDRGPAALPDAVFADNLRNFLSSFCEPLVLADDALDFKMLTHALSGFGRMRLSPTPPYRQMLVTFGDVLTRIEDYFETRPEARMKRHHARVDAEALRWAFEQAMRRGSRGFSGGMTFI
ncbi:hypothetical protein ACFPN1_12105 [Lysobacter yangpyeongensis]|uniref:Uncharacterized protein n=1 Tax=Lysobacter yangpyeongensis TaxID=346182 RepID=A0ABW0SP23_9GAMM